MELLLFELKNVFLPELSLLIAIAVIFIMELFFLNLFINYQAELHLSQQFSRCSQFQLGLLIQDIRFFLKCMFNRIFRLC